MLDEDIVSILLYADDVVFLAENENDLQLLLDTLNGVFQMILLICRSLKSFILGHSHVIRQILISCCP